MIRFPLPYLLFRSAARMSLARALRSFSTSTPIYLSVLIFLSFLRVRSTSAGGQDIHCQACKIFVETFLKGYENTAKSNFGGGNTDWEETRLGSYYKSETRLVEILEHVCSEGSDKDLNHQCHQFVEVNEDIIEKWYFHLQKNEPTFEKWLCITSAKVCCPANTFGENCQACPGGTTFPCTARGDCDGNGTTKGTGKCRCQKGYTGEVCDACSYGFNLVERNDTYVLCEDINECVIDPRICLDNEYCYNIVGAYKCMKCNPACRGCTGLGAAKCRACADGYSLVNGTCTDNVELTRPSRESENERNDREPPSSTPSAAEPSLSTDAHSEL